MCGNSLSAQAKFWNILVVMSTTKKRKGKNDYVDNEQWTRWAKARQSVHFCPFVSKWTRSGRTRFSTSLRFVHLRKKIVAEVNLVEHVFFSVHLFRSQWKWTRPLFVHSIHDEIRVLLQSCSTVILHLFFVAVVCYTVLVCFHFWHVSWSRDIMGQFERHPLFCE